MEKIEKKFSENQRKIMDYLWSDGRIRHKKTILLHLLEHGLLISPKALHMELGILKRACLIRGAFGFYAAALTEKEYDERLQHYREFVAEMMALLDTLDD